jgi:hypothetical protein
MQSTFADQPVIIVSKSTQKIIEKYSAVAISSFVSGQTGTCFIESPFLTPLH